MILHPILLSKFFPVFLASLSLLFGIFGVVSAQTPVRPHMTGKPTTPSPVPTTPSAPSAPSVHRAQATTSGAGSITTPNKTTAPVSSTASSSSREQVFQEANQYYNQGQYREAAQLFQQLIPSPTWANFAVFYNLGNCYVRLQEYGRALAYYRKAQRLRPNHLDLLHNIQLIYRKLGKTEPLHDDIRLKFLFWYYLLSLEQIFYVVILFTSVCLLLWSVHLRRSSRGLLGLRWPVAALATLTLVLWSSLGIKLYQERLLTQGIITQNLVTARSGYGDQFEPMFRLTEADQITILETLDVKTPLGTQTWLRVEATLLEKDNKTHIRKTGWIPATTAQTI